MPPVVASSASATFASTKSPFGSTCASCSRAKWLPCDLQSWPQGLCTTQDSRLQVGTKPSRQQGAATSMQRLF